MSETPNDTLFFYYLEQNAKKDLERLREEQKRRQEKRKMKKKNPQYTEEELETGVQNFIHKARQILYKDWDMKNKSLRRKVLAAFVICNQNEELPILIENPTYVPHFINLHEIAQIVSDDISLSDLIRHPVACICRQLTEKGLLQKGDEIKTVIGKNQVPYEIPMWRITPNGSFAHREHIRSEKTIIVGDE